MPPRIRKYNPGFLSEDELIRVFAARQEDLDLILQVIRENTGRSNQHLLVIGARGMGKSTLLLRAVAELRRTEQLRDAWHPIVFGEESYTVTSPGRFWLEALVHLAQETGDQRWKRAWEELRGEPEERLRLRALGQLMDFADSKGKRLLLVVENLHMLFDGQIRDADAWAIRDVLLNEPRIMLLGSAVSRFSGIMEYNRALYEVFRIHEMQPLNTEECARMWRAVAGQEIDLDHVRPLEILTGGNPRLLAILASVENGFSLKNLAEDLERLIDDHTDYLKGFLDNLPPVERTAYLALAEIWDPATASEVAQHTGMSVNIASSLLKRLEERGAVSVVDTRKKRKTYQVTERLYNIYHLMRRHRGEASRVKAAVRFMSSFYAPDDLLTRTRQIAEEACLLSPEERREHFQAVREILNTVKDAEFHREFIKAVPSTFFEAEDALPELKALYMAERAATESIEKPAEMPHWVKKLEEAASLLRRPDRASEAVQFIKEAIAAVPDEASAQAALGAILYSSLGKYDLAETACRRAIQLKPDFAEAWALLGMLLHERKKNYREAEIAYQKAIELKMDFASAWAQLGQLLHENLKNYPGAEGAYRKAVELKPDYAWAWAQLGQLLHENLKNYPEAEGAYRKTIELKPDNAWAWGQLGQLLHQNLKNYSEAEGAYRKAIELKPDYAWAWAQLGQLLHENLKNYPEAEGAYRKAIRLKPDEPWLWLQLGQLLHENFKKYSEAEVAYRRVTELEPDSPWLSSLLLSVLLAMPERQADALAFFDQTLQTHPDQPEFFNAFAWELYKSGNRVYLQKAEHAARRAVELAPEAGHAQHTLATILLAQGKPVEALDAAQKLLADAQTVEKNVADAIELFVELAVAGEAKNALRILQSSPSVKLLEPLVAGMLLFLNEDVKSATEILEVGKDVAKRIQERKRQRETS